MSFIQRKFDDLYTDESCRDRKSTHADENENTATSTCESSVTDEMWIPEEKSPARKFMVIVILFIINLLNYADRYTVAGVLTDIQKYYDIDDAQAGLLQTVFIAFFMIFSPVCGFLGDRYNRKIIMIVGIFVWVLAVFASTYVPANMFWLFLLLRGIVGVGEASYATISPSIIADIFTGNMRSRMFMFFYFAIPVGSGIGYMAGSKLATAFGSWEWGIRLTPILGVLCLALITIFVYEPERGANESTMKDVTKSKEKQSKESDDKSAAGNYLEDLKALATNPTYMFSTFGYTAIVFVTGTLSWWAPTAIQHASAASSHLNSTSMLSDSEKNGITFKFGLITMLGGFLGVTVGTVLSMWLRNGKYIFACCKTPRSDPIICALGAVIAVPTHFVALIGILDFNFTLAYVFIFTAITGLCFNWAVNVDMLMTVIVPSRRNSANSWQILISHLFGDASGPYIIGAISDWIRGGDKTPTAHYKSLVHSFYIPNAICVISVVLFLIASMTLLRDQARFKEEMGIVESLPEMSEIEKNSVSKSESLRVKEGKVNESFE